MLASLNHPHIWQIYGLEHVSAVSAPATGLQALVLELVDGPTLADRLAHGSIPVPEAIPIARQIAEAAGCVCFGGAVLTDVLQCMSCRDGP